MNFDNTYVSIDLDAIAANFDRIAAKAGTRVMAVIKADAYGHGAVQVGRKLEALGAEHIADNTEQLLEFILK